MRMELTFLGALGLCAVAAGCGAKVTVDLGPQGTGGTGGATTTSTGTPTNTTSGGVTCGGLSCSGGSDGSCQCQGVCNAQNLEVQCTPIQGGGACDCIENGITIAKCQQPGAATCNFTTECCASQFFGGGG